MSRATIAPKAGVPMPGLDADDAAWEAWSVARAAEREAEDLAHPLGYKGPLRRIDGARGEYQHGKCFSLRQATEMHVMPAMNEHRWRFGSKWDWCIGVIALNDGSWLADHAASIRPPAGYNRTRDRGLSLPSGGFFTYSRRFCTRDAAIRANAAYVIRRARRQHRWKPDPNGHAWERRNMWPGGDMPTDVAQAIISWAMDVAARPAPVLYVAPPPPPAPPPEPTNLLEWIEQGRQA